MTKIVETACTRGSAHIYYSSSNASDELWIQACRLEPCLEFLSAECAPSFRRHLHRLEESHRRNVLVGNRENIKNNLHNLLSFMHKDQCENTDCPWLAHLCEHVESEDGDQFPSCSLLNINMMEDLRAATQPRATTLTIAGSFRRPTSDDGSGSFAVDFTKGLDLLRTPRPSGMGRGSSWIHPSEQADRDALSRNEQSDHAKPRDSVELDATGKTNL